MRRDGTRTIHLADLQRYIFTDEYTPQLGPGGEHELCFMNSNGKSLFFSPLTAFSPFFFAPGKNSDFDWKYC